MLIEDLIYQWLKVCGSWVKFHQVTKLLKTSDTDMSMLSRVVTGLKFQL